MVLSGSAIRPFSISSKPRVDPFVQERPKRSHGHIVFVDDLLQRIAVGEHRVEGASPMVRTLRRHRAAFHAVRWRSQ